MQARIRNRRRAARAATIAVAVGACGAAAPALAGPTAWEDASWNRPVTATAGGWFTSADGGTTVVGRRDAAYPSQAYLEARYCTPFGPNTQVVGMGITRTRWHATSQDMNGAVSVFTPQSKYYGVDGGKTTSRTTQRFLKDHVVEGIDLELKSGVSIVDTYRFPGGACVASRLAVRGNDDTVVDTPGFTPKVTQRLTRVLIEDLQGPAVSNVAAPTGWVTGDSVGVSWLSSDNAYRRASTGIRVVGAGTADLGNAADGKHSASAALGALVDGSHDVCAYRAGSGWAEAQSCVAIRIDRTNPSAPPVHVAPDLPGFSAGPVTVASGAADDGSGSGWARNQVSLDGGPWQDTDGSFVVDIDGEHAVRVRAVDRAGRRSVPTDPLIVRVDRTPPVVADVLTDGQRGTLGWTMTDAIGLGDCSVRVMLSGPGTNGALITAVERPASSFASAAEVVLPVGTMPNGLYDIHLTVCDGAGNVTSEQTTLDWTGNPDGVLTGSWARFVPMDLASPGVSRRRDLAGVIVPAPRRTVGAPFTVAGRLQRPDGSSFANAAVEVRDSLGRYAGGFRTDERGAFSVVLRAGVGGAWTINSVGSQVRKPLAWLEVRPVVAARASMRSARRVLVVTGRMRPGVGVGGKAVTLQWFDTLTQRWRPVIVGRVRSGGGFRLVYRFSRPGRYAVSVRVVVPHDAGWPYLTGVSRPMVVQVGLA